METVFSNISHNPIRGNTVAKPGRTVLVVAITALATILLVTVAGVGVWLMSGKGAAGNRNVSNSVANSNTERKHRSITPSPTVAGTPTESPNANSISNSTENKVSDAESVRVKKDISDRIEKWRTQAESLDLTGHLENYANRVNYYNKLRSDRDFIRRDKARAWSRFDSIDVEITDLKITPGIDGNEAVAEFDKEWDFDGERQSTGKVRSQLRLEKIGGKWLITGERDLKVYR
ncbi:MAG: hypothetical protein WBD22_09390 [Pyrinomonadaceae bacterium]